MLNYEGTKAIAQPLLTRTEGMEDGMVGLERLKAIAKLAGEAQFGNMHAVEFLLNYVLDMEATDAQSVKHAGRRLVALFLDPEIPHDVRNEITRQAFEFCLAVEAINAYRTAQGQAAEYKVPAYVEYLARHASTLSTFWQAASRSVPGVKVATADMSGVGA
ncbi:hypothetical protein [Noviherbaspirillum galbum]|uniref:Uncharacterized protein n=1 Tax=Noviherbaspirillum galbum TaxID=2709383 RepID=A0A6B3SXE8_9BURK|nr:hypothetical protein [Noviherbaspirillum galbum]NEX64225.1 hypothetical protein [Noviherbaspirillum galbum]